MRAFSLDYLVGARLQRQRHVEPQRSCSLEINDKLELGRLLDRQVRRLFTLQDAAGVNSGLTIGFGMANAVARQSARRDEFAPGINRGDCMAAGERHDLSMLIHKKHIVAGNQRADALAGQRAEGVIDVAFIAGIYDWDLPPRPSRGVLRVADVGWRIRRG